MIAGVFAALLYVASVLHPPALLLLRPQQVRISWTEREHEISVMWATWFPLLSPSLRYTATSCSTSPQPANWVSLPPSVRTFRKNLKYDLFFELLYTVLIPGLSPDCEYQFYVGTGLHLWSKPFTFKGVTPYYTPPYTEASLTRPARVAILGDMGIGTYSMATRLHLRSATVHGEIDAIMHLGDIGYDLERHMGGTADKFFREIEEVAGNVPYLAIAGNHEHRQNFTHFQNLFRMPVTAANQGSNFFYSFNLGRAHFVALNAEAYFYLPYACAQTQYNWLEEDLQLANAQRSEVPWIVVFTHKPLYCQVDWRRPMEESKQFKCNYDCDHECKVLRGEWEDLFYRYGVDFVFGAHMHDYEREYPIYQNRTIPSDVDTPNYHLNPRAQISILSGTAGSDHVTPTQLHDALSSTPQLWNAAYFDNYGFGILEVINRTHVHWEEFDSETRSILDHVTVEKTWERYPSSLN